MADDFFSQRYKTQRANHDISQDIKALETPTFGDEKKDEDAFASAENKQTANPFQAQIVDDDNRSGYTMDDLLNGYVIDEETLSAIDECLIHISSEWDLSDILSKDLADCEQLIIKKCNEAHATILSSIIDPPNILYETLLRLARKMKAISLVLGNQKMIYVPQNIEELSEIGAKMHGINSIITIRTNRAGHKSVDDSDYKSGHDDDAEPKSGNMFAENASKDLESLIFCKRRLYQNTATCKKREKQYLESKKKKISIIGGVTKQSTKQDSNAEHKMSQQIESNTELTESRAELAPLQSITKSSSHSTLNKTHPHDIACEGCGNSISFVADFEQIICYKVPIKGNELFYFHDSFCVTLRRLKESIRRYVLDESLPEARRAETIVGYIRNLLTNFSTLITTGGVVPRPNPVSSGDAKGSAHKLAMMQFVRSSAHKLILRQQALEGREAKNFEDEYSWIFANIPQSVQYTDMVVYGPCLAKYIIQQLLSKQLQSLWLTLAFVVSGMTATTSLQIIEEHRPALAKVKEMDDLDVVLTSMIEAADYTIAMALYLSAYMMENAERDLSRSEDFEEVGNKYIRIASQLVASVESDHLLSLLLETPTDIAHLSVFEIAIKNGIADFMDDSRIQMLMAHMWSEFDFLDPGKNYRTQDIELFDVLGRLAMRPARFYYCPVGRYWTESVMYMVYICVVSAVVNGANYDLSSSLSVTEYVMWIFNIGFVAGEMTQMAFDGAAYLTDVGNYFDIFIMANWVILAVMRFGCKTAFDGSEQCTASSGHDTVEQGLSRNKSAVLIYMAVFCAQICVLWSRVCLIFATSREVGPFISMIPGMVRDILKWTFVLGIFYIGFSFGSHFIIAGDVSELCAADGSLESFSIVAEYNFILLMGQSEWSILEANDCMGKGRSLLLKLYMFGFSVLGTVLLLNLLIAMMASTYEKIREGTAKQVNFSRAEQVFGLSHSNAIIPPPLNVLVFAFSVLWFLMEFLVWLCSCGRYILNIEKLVPVSIDYDHDAGLAANKNARNKVTTLKCCGVFQRLKKKTGLLQKMATNTAETARYCQFCRCYMRVNGNISRYFKLFVNYRLDEADVKFMKSLMQNAGICPQCYRPYRIYEATETGMKTNRLYRWQVILEVISFYVFMWVIYLPLIILISLPALSNALSSFIDAVTSATKIVEGNRQIMKDDKYVQLVENIVEKEGTTDSQVLSSQVTQLNRKLIQVKMNQQATTNVLAEQSMELEEHTRILKGMVPYIKQIDTKIDKSRSTVQELHKEQIDAFQSGMQRQSVKLEQSKDVLDAHTSYNKSHQQHLAEQMLVAQHHADEMNLFKEQLDELKILRENDEQLKQQQAARQEALEKQHAAEIKSFNKELKQQRVLREIEVAKQEKMSKKQAEELQKAHIGQVQNLEKQIQRQEFLRAIEEQKIIEEQEKRELLQEKQAQDMAILTAQMEQLRFMKDAEAKKRQIELKMRKRQTKKMKDVEKEILRIKQKKKRQKKSDNSFALQQSARMEQLQSELIHMKFEQERKEKEDKQQKEVEEIKTIQHKSRVLQLQEQMEKMIREQKRAENQQNRTKMKAESDKMKHKIQMEKMKHSMNKLQSFSMDNSVDSRDEILEKVEDKKDGDDDKNIDKQYKIAVTGVSDEEVDKNKEVADEEVVDEEVVDGGIGDEDGNEEEEEEEDAGDWVIGIRG